jgi:hypothetical protein
LVRFTNIYKLAIRYITIDTSFPHQIVSFDNVPVNYSNGPLVNITVSRTIINYYANTINFTDQALTVLSPYNTFSRSLSDHKIVMFMTSLFMRGITETPTVFVPLDFNINAQVMSNTTYLINANFGLQFSVEKLHFSMIIFN